ncbi:MAG TPA: glycosyltransferase family 39 protein [Gemmatimonadaceae bacterium]|nr:glycosyltransferase family 39 protein [Gemmatimonadaceae bacterium]
MTDVAAAEPAPVTTSTHATSERAAWYAALGVIGFATVLRVIVGMRMPLLPDETYYWDWSRHLSFGYFDHPPMIAWMIAFGTNLFGTNPIGVRAMTILTGTVAALFMALMARRVAGSHTAAETAIVISVMPLASAGLVLATNDSPLLACVAVTLYFLVRAIQAEPRSRESLVSWCFAGVALGFAFWSKYTSILLPVGVLIAFASHRRLWPRFAEWGPYAACAIATLIFLPVLMWNARHDWISMVYQLEHGLGSAITLRGAWRHEGDLLGGQAGLATPILFVMIVVAVARSLRPSLGPEKWLLAVVSTFFFAFFVYSALRKRVEPNWPAPAYIGGVVLCAAYKWSETAKRWRAAGIALAGVLSLAVYLHALKPIVPVPPPKDPIARAFGWREMAEATALAGRAPLPNGAKAWLAADRYQEASQIAYWLPGHPETFALNLGGRRNQYDLWPRFIDRARAGDRLVVVVDETVGVHEAVMELTPHFTSILRGELIELRRDGGVIGQRRLYTMDGWKGSWP